MDQSIKAGIIGTVLAVVVNLISPVYLDWFPAFIVAIFAIYVYRLNTLKDGLIAAFMTYIFNNGILGTLTLATYYNQQYPAFTVDAYTMLSPLITAISALAAAYIGVLLTKQRTPPPPKQQPQQTTDIPPELQTV
jgi:hypothetical protein